MLNRLMRKIIAFSRAVCFNCEQVNRPHDRSNRPVELSLLYVSERGLRIICGILIIVYTLVPKIYMERLTSELA